MSCESQLLYAPQGQSSEWLTDEGRRIWTSEHLWNQFGFWTIEMKWVLIDQITWKIIDVSIVLCVISCCRQHRRVVINSEGLIYWTQKFFFIKYRVCFNSLTLSHAFHREECNLGVSGLWIMRGIETFSGRIEKTGVRRGWETADKWTALRGSALGEGAVRGSWDLIGVIGSEVCSGKNLQS